MRRREFVAAVSFGAGARAPAARSAKEAEMQATISPPRILAVSAHPADFCSRAGGTLIKHVAAGSKVKVIWLTQGESDESAFLIRSEEHTSELQSRQYLVCRLLLEKKHTISHAHLQHCTSRRAYSHATPDTHA